MKTYLVSEEVLQHVLDSLRNHVWHHVPTLSQKRDLENAAELLRTLLAKEPSEPVTTATFYDEAGAEHDEPLYRKDA